MEDLWDDDNSDDNSDGESDGIVVIVAVTTDIVLCVRIGGWHGTSQ